MRPHWRTARRICIVRADAINLSTDLVQAGVVFNDAVRISTGLFSTPQNSGNSNPFLTSYTTDIHAVQNDIAAMLATPGNVTLGGQAFTLNTTDTAVLTNVQNQLTTLAERRAADHQRGDADGCGPDASTRCRTRSCRRSTTIRISRPRSTTSRSWPRPAPTTSRSRTFRRAPTIRRRSRRRRRARA